MDDAPVGGESRAPALEDLTGLCQALNQERARYILIGGFAVILHGFVRTTKDIDILIDPSAENLQAVKRALSTLPDNAAELVADEDVEKYQVVRVADAVVDPEHVVMKQNLSGRQPNQDTWTPSFPSIRRLRLSAALRYSSWRREDGP